MTNDPLQPGNVTQSVPVPQPTMAPEAPAAAAPATPVHAAPPAVVAASTSRGGGWLNVLLLGALALAIGGVAFAVGRTTAPVALAGTGTFPGNGPIVRSDGSFDPNAPGGPGQGRTGFVLGNGITLDGTVTAVDGDQLTLTLASGETMTLTLDDDTTYHAATDAAADDVTVGDDVSVRVDAGRAAIGNGPAASAGTPSMTAGDVTVRP